MSHDIEHAPITIDKSENDRIGGISRVLDELYEARKFDQPPPKLSATMRRAMIVELLDDGVMKRDIAQLLGVSRNTIWHDERRIAEDCNSGIYFESVAQTAERINRRFGVLYSKAMRDKDYRLATHIENSRIEKLQSIGVIKKNAEQIDITADDRSKAAIVDAIIAGIGVISTTGTAKQVEPVQE